MKVDKHGYGYLSYAPSEGGKDADKAPIIKQRGKVVK